MTSTCKMEVTCPSCGHDQVVTIWQSIDASLDPELRKRLFDAEINVGVCELCEEKRFMPMPILYRDMERQFCVMYYPYDLDYWGPEEMSDFFTVQGKFAERVPFYNPHIVLSFGEMLRYILLRELLHEKRNTGAVEGKGLLN
ncbi:MAG: CpXC domain-containing protein [Desulfobacteraceae bacterium]